MPHDALHLPSIPYTVITKHNSTVAVRNNNGHTITRNVSHFKPIPNQRHAEPDTDDETNDNNVTDLDNNQQQVGNSQPERANRKKFADRVVRGKCQKDIIMPYHGLCMFEL